MFVYVYENVYVAKMLRVKAAFIYKFYIISYYYIHMVGIYKQEG